MSLKDEIVEMVDDPFWKEIEKRQKFGSYAWNGYESLIPSINAQYRSTNSDVNQYILKALDLVLDELPDEINPIPLEDSIAMCRTDTNSGFPAFTSKPFTQLDENGESYTILDEELYDCYYLIAKNVLRGKMHTHLPAVIFKRIQPGNGTESKARIVQCVSRGILWAEGTFIRPLLEAMRALEPYSGFNRWDLGLQNTIHNILGKDHVASIDYTQYDSLIGQYLPLLLQKMAEKYPQSGALLEWSAQYYRTAPLLTPHGVLRGEHGLFSGMLGTATYGTLLNRVLIKAVELAVNAQDTLIKDPVHLGFGDDTVYGWNGDVTVEVIISTLQGFGMELNIQKQEYCSKHDADKYVSFQGCYWKARPDGSPPVPVYSLVRLAARLAFVEYIHDNCKLIYSAGLKVDDVYGAEVVGPIITALIAKLFEAIYHPYIEDFISRYQDGWVHYLDPRVCFDNDVFYHGDTYIVEEVAEGPEWNSSRYLELEIPKILIKGVGNCCRKEGEHIVEYSISELKRLSNIRNPKTTRKSHQHESDLNEQIVADEWDSALQNSVYIAMRNIK